MVRRVTNRLITIVTPQVIRRAQKQEKWSVIPSLTGMRERQTDRRTGEQTSRVVCAMHTSCGETDFYKTAFHRSFLWVPLAHDDVNSHAIPLAAIDFHVVFVIYNTENHQTNVPSAD